MKKESCKMDIKVFAKILAICFYFVCQVEYDKKKCGLKSGCFFVQNLSCNTFLFRVLDLNFAVEQIKIKFSLKKIELYEKHQIPEQEA